MLIWLKKSTVLTAIHSLRSSPSGNITACLRLPLPRVASACFKSSYWWDPSGIFFFGLNVFEERLLKRKLILASPRGRGPRPVRLGAAAGTGRQRTVRGSTGLPKLHGPGLVPSSSRRDQAPTAGSSALPPTAPRAKMRNQEDLARPGFFPSRWASPCPFLSSANQYSVGTGGKWGQLGAAVNSSVAEGRLPALLGDCFAI